MEIDKEESIIVRYIPQYIVIETRYKPRQFYEETEEASNVKDESDEVVEVEASDQGIHFEPCDIIECEEELAADELIVETKEVASFDGIDVEIRPQPSPTSPSPQKRRYNFKARKLLDDWFFSHLNVSLWRITSSHSYKRFDFCCCCHSRVHIPPKTKRKLSWPERI